MDINLPTASWEGEDIISGADLSYLLKTQPKTAHIPIILLTAYAILQERQLLLENSKADDFFTKPISDYNELLEAIDKLTINN